MRIFSGLVVFLLVFVAVGAAMHVALYGKPGVFIWSLENNSGSYSLSRTTLAVAPIAPATVSIAPGAEQTNEEERLETAPAPAPSAESSKDAGDPNEIALFNGKDLGTWEKTQFGGEGDVFVNEDGNLEFGFGAVITGINWTEDVPATSNYELTLDAMKLDGNDFFVALTFPVKDSHATFVIGGWGGGIVGISSVDDLNASENETMNIEGFEDDKWYKIKVRVTDGKLEAWIDEDQMVDLELAGRKISLYPGDIELSAPIGIASYQTRAQYRNFIWRNLSAAE